MLFYSLVWLSQQTRILVTHGMSFLPQADFILVLGDGEITESGSYQELLSRHGAFADFIHTFANAERKESAIQRGEKHSVKRRPCKSNSVCAERRT